MNFYSHCIVDSSVTDVSAGYSSNAIGHRLDDDSNYGSSALAERLEDDQCRFFILFL